MPEISEREYDELRQTQRRFEWLLALWRETCSGDTPQSIIATIDYAIARGHNPVDVARETALVRRRRKQRKPAGLG